MTIRRLNFTGIIVLVAIYLLASAPPPLGDPSERSLGTRAIPVEKMFDAMNAINTAARTIYTKRIVGGGLKAGLKFGEDWAEPGVEKGPLPALFLRLVAAQLETKPPLLGLYLGSDQPINASNLFAGPQAAMFAELKTDRLPRWSANPENGHVGMYADIASAKPCVSCHNGHEDSPKTDWLLDDVMGATTWTYPDAVVPPDDYLATTEALFEAIDESYRLFFDKAADFTNPPAGGDTWPDEDAYALPSPKVFMAQVRDSAATAVLTEIILLSEVTQ